MIRFLLGLGEVNIQNTFPFWHPEGALVLSLRSRWRHADRVQSWRRSGIPGITTAREASFRALARNLTFRTKRENSGLYLNKDRHPDRREGSSRALARVYWALIGICSKYYSFLALWGCMSSLPTVEMTATESAWGPSLALGMTAPWRVAGTRAAKSPPVTTNPSEVSR